MNFSPSDEMDLVGRLRSGDTKALEMIVERFHKPAYFLALHLAGCDKNKAYEITVYSFSQTLQRNFNAMSEPFSVALLRCVISRCRDAVLANTFSTSELTDLPVEKKEPLRIVKEALFGLSFEDRVLLLLRDQQNLPYEQIAWIVGSSRKDAKQQTFRARHKHREKVEAVLNRARFSL